LLVFHVALAFMPAEDSAPQQNVRTLENLMLRSLQAGGSFVTAP